ncbi:MAG: 50S ribosomal protein L18e [Nanoarchaeota archaeon]|nr:50S ribosomal protein L18e [Nanoarchaeota archaeon]
MVKRTGATNLEMIDLIHDLKKEKTPFWKSIVKELSRSTRSRRAVNLSRINRYAKKGETIIVPGKVLGSGNAPEKIVIAAWSFTKTAEDKIKSVNGKTLNIRDLLKNKPKRVRIIG